MENKLFKEFVTSLKEGRDIIKGKGKPGRVFKFKKKDIATVRKKHKLTQEKMASMVNVPVATLRNWEQGRTQPDATGQTLLRIVDEFPEIFAKLSKKPPIVYGAINK